MKSSFTIPEDVVSRTVRGEEVLLNLKTSHYFGLDSIGTLVWSALKKKQGLDQMVELVCAEYDAKPELVRKDILALLSKMKAKGLLTEN
ncbi:MAG TPA: PqqD family protein [Bdellovibrionales bacterium]|nr:PqqD family protein [Bdellovibrionales bacterium]